MLPDASLKPVSKLRQLDLLCVLFCTQSQPVLYTQDFCGGQMSNVKNNVFLTSAFLVLAGGDQSFASWWMGFFLWAST